MKLKEVIKKITPIAITGNEEIEITGVNMDSRLIKEGHMFVAVKGTQADGHNYISKAISYSFGGINLEDINAPRCFEIEDNDRILGLAEMMNYPGVIFGDPEVHKKIKRGGF